MDSNPNFNRWDVIATLPMEEVKHFILSSYPATELFIATDLSVLGGYSQPLKVLDFGCGIGRELSGMSTGWNVVGFDCPEMINRLSSFLDLSRRPNITASSNWDWVKEQRFDVIYCELVLQHIAESLLDVRLQEMLPMSPKLHVHGRTWLDDGNKQLRPIIKRYWKEQLHFIEGDCFRADYLRPEASE